MRDAHSGTLGRDTEIVARNVSWVNYNFKIESMPRDSEDSARRALFALISPLHREVRANETLLGF